MDALLQPAHLGALAWLVAGLILSAIETLAPGAFFIWFGAAAAIVGAVDYFLPMGFVAQLILFAVLVAGARSCRAAGLRVVRQGARAAAPEPRACDDRGRLLPGRSHRARPWAHPRRRQFLASRRTRLPGRRQGEGSRYRERFAVTCRARRLTPWKSRFSDRPAPEWSSASAPLPFRCRAARPRSPAAHARP